LMPRRRDGTSGRPSGRPSPVFKRGLPDTGLKAEPERTVDRTGNREPQASRQRTGRRLLKVPAGARTDAPKIAVAGARKSTHSEYPSRCSCERPRPAPDVVWTFTGGTRGFFDSGWRRRTESGNANPALGHAGAISRASTSAPPSSSRPQRSEEPGSESHGRCGGSPIPARPSAVRDDEEEVRRPG